MLFLEKEKYSLSLYLSLWNSCCELLKSACPENLKQKALWNSKLQVKGHIDYLLTFIAYTDKGRLAGVLSFYLYAGMKVFHPTHC